ncbi:Zn(II)2Cys6 transcription factor [Aspergillus fijiensis CBS 313.89]|uniref:Zn(2)-C6 fungal-type domain-containing protein n=1 Tax=Aspergillus fijiensis CBS 313.89 TaxID=1448319 RepID=A0A8G1RI73_9EURO|nr:uncharacterized protein BO72DRAFT_489914 [Aspergillus fijiensis CBS 313.89]RAK72235.1 hypothetical protein BO72DRAFT_489914 [Aspergillus fijiensis CBS 313.89]
MPNNHDDNLLRKRSRTGCWTCRKRHQKCDEHKPTCMNCRLRGVDCGGYGIMLTDFTARGNRTGQMVSKMKRNRPADHEVDVIPRASRPSATSGLESMEIGENLKSPFELIDDSLFLDLDSRWDEDLDWIVSAEPEAQRNALTPPTVAEVAGDCFVDTAHSVEMSTLDPSLLFMHESTALPPIPQDPFDQYLFTYYMETLALRLYPVKKDQNPYRTIYGALATESEPLLKSIMLASALHLTKQGRLPRFAIKPYRMAVQESFREALKSQDEAWSLGVTVLLSVVFDIIGTGLATWSSKLIGCRRLLEIAFSASTSTKTLTGLHCVLLQYNWAVTMGKTLVRGLVPEETLNELKCIDELPSRGSSTEGLEMASHQRQWWDNLPDYQMHLFLREATDYSLAVARISATESKDEMLRLMPRVADLVNRIQGWHPNISTVPEEFVSSIQHFNCIWKVGMLCFVYSEIYALGPNDDLIKDLVQASMEPLDKLSWLQACLFPVFMIALHARTEQAHSRFEAKLNEMHTVLEFQGPLSVISILRAIWQQTSATHEGRVQWREVIRELGAEINVLL